MKKTKVLNSYYKKYFLKSPKIAMLGLNPHNNENKRNSVENKIIKKSINKLKKNIFLMSTMDKKSVSDIKSKLVNYVS